MIEARTGPSVTIGGADLVAFNRQMLEAVAMFRRRNGIAPYVFLQVAIEVNRLVNGSGAEPRNTAAEPDEPVSDQPARATLSVKEAARAAGVSASYLRRLVRDGILEVRPSLGPGYAVYADTLAAWQERRSRKENERKAA